jgi:hypothetical protein
MLQMVCQELGTTPVISYGALWGLVSSVHVATRLLIWCYFITAISDRGRHKMPDLVLLGQVDSSTKR